MTISFGSVCSGIEAASVAWHPLGWRTAFVSEIEAFPQAVLRHHYGCNVVARSPRRKSMARDANGVWNFGDFTTIRPRMLRKLGVALPDVLIGGTPCQSFSVAGKRLSMADARGNLAFSYVRLSHAIDNAKQHGGGRGLVTIWENVPGVLTTRDNAFGCLLAGFVGADDPLCAPDEPGRWPHAGMVAGPRARAAWRVFDAQYFGLAQRRARVLVVVSYRAAIDPAAVLFERQSMQGNPAPRRQPGQSVAPIAGARAQGGGGLGTGTECDGALIGAFGGNNTSGARDVSTALTALTAHHGRQDFESETLIAFAQNSRSEVREIGGDGKIAGALASEPGAQQQSYLAYSIQERAISENLDNGPQGKGYQADLAYTLEARNKVQAVAADLAVRRLMPIECERLQGFPEGYTDVAYRGRVNAPDGPRYKALGNSKATNLVQWVGVRLDRHLRGLP